MTIRWFKDSPDAGDPSCLCSWCGALISADEAPILRLFSMANDEARFHRRCVSAALYGSGLLPQTDSPDMEGYYGD